MNAPTREILNGNLVINKTNCVSDYTSADHVGPVTVYAVAMDGPDEGPYLLNTTAESKEAALKLLEGINPAPWPYAVCGISEAK